MNKTENFSAKAISWIMAAVMAFLTVVSLLYRSYIDVTYQEVICYRKDNVILAVVTLVLFMLFLRMGTKKRWFGKLQERKLLIFVLVYAAAVSGIWACVSRSIPTADQKSVLDCAQGLMNGDYSCMEYDGYLQYNRHQVGIVWFYELFSRIFTGGQVKYQAVYALNTVMITGIFWGLYLVTEELTKKKETVIMELLLSMGMFPLMLYSTFAYGLVPGLFFAVFGIYFLLKLVKTGKWYDGVLMSVFFALAALMKSNYYIFLIGAVIVLAVKAFSGRKYRKILIFAVLAIGLTFFFQGAAKREYINRTGKEFGDTIPNSTYLAMGMQEGAMAPGWFNGYNHVTYRLNGYDAEVTDRIAKEYIGDRLAEFAANPKECLEFYYKKIVSQWNEVTYECFWISNNGNTLPGRTKVVEDLYTGKLHTAAEAVMNLYQLLLFAGTLICCLMLTRKKNIEETILILCILGGFLFHILWEGKSQYLISYIPLMLPCAAIGWSGVGGKSKRSSR